jgi:peroxiredoxin
MRRIAVNEANGGPVVLGVMVWGAGPGLARTFADENKVPFPILVDSDGRFTRAYGNFAVPLHVFIRPDGRIASTHSGSLSQREFRAYVSDLERVPKPPATRRGR